MKNIWFVVAMMVCIGLTLSCRKYLDEKPDKKLVVPETLTDLQALLDNITLNLGSTPVGAEASADNYYLDYADWNSLTDLNAKGLYNWSYFENTNTASWGYGNVNTANTVLQQVNKVEETAANKVERDAIKGAGLFFRSFVFYGMADVFAKPYDKSTAANDMGIPLKLTPDIDEPVFRASVAATYDRILTDLQEASQLLPLASAYKTRPNKPAAWGLLARIYLSMQEYPLAERYADSALKYHNTLLDYNNISTSAANPFTMFNAEVIFHSRGGAGSSLIQARARMDSNLYLSYAPNDLRKVLFFKLNSNGSYAFKGSYEGINSGNSWFNGIATDEVLLIRAECRARAGNISGAVNDLNTLMQKRWKNGTFVPFTAVNADEALDKILTERRKELVMRYLRWSDLRRLNKDPKYAVTLKRNLNGTIVELPPNDLRYVLLIPETVIRMTGIPQNPR